MITKNGLLRPNRNSSLITSSKPKTKPVKVDTGEPDIDFNNIPTIQGTYRASKVNLTANNSTKGTAESVTDVPSTTKQASTRERTTDAPSTSLTSSTLGEDKSSETPTTSATKTTSSTTTTRGDLDIFKDFRNPALETSPWHPIIPVYVNPELKLLPDHNRTESSTRVSTVSASTSDPRDDVPKASTSGSTSPTPSAMPGLSLESPNFRDVLGMSTFDTDDSDFPRDRVVPSSSTVSKLDGSPEIEVAGQLPPETYSIRLRASSSKREDSDKVTSNPEILATRQAFETAKEDTSLAGKRKESSATREPEAKLGDPVSTTTSTTTMTTTMWLDHVGSYRDEEVASQSPDTSGIGVAEPVLDTEVELEAKNSYSSVSANEDEEEDALRDRKADVGPQRPVYTSYNTPDLNGDSLGSSLIRNSATMKPFRHTIPVDKITSVVSYSNDVPARDPFLPDVPLVATDAVESPQDRTATPLANLERVVKVETFVKAQNDDDAMIKLPHYGRVTSTDSSVARVTDDRNDKSPQPSTTELYWESANAKASDGKKSVSRNSTFVEVDTVKHTPSESEEENWESYAEETAANAAADKLQKKVYNDTLKAYVVENLVTLAPVKSNTGIGRPVRPRPKIDSLEQLFGVRDYTRDGDTANETTEPTVTTVVPERLTSPQEVTQFDDENEESSNNGKNTVIGQIVEVVTSISTKVSSNIKGDPVVLKLIVGNSTAQPVIRLEKTSTSGQEEDRSFGTIANTTEEPVSSTWSQQRPLSSANLRTMQTSDRKISALEEENRILLEKLKQLAQIRTDGDSVQSASDVDAMLRPLWTSDAPSPNIDELKKIADVAVGHEALKNASSGVTLNRDGVEIYTKVLNKLEDRADEATLTTRGPVASDDGNSSTSL